MKRHFFKNLLLMGLCFPAAAQSVPARINLVVVEGEGISAGVRQRVSRDPVVIVEDDDHRPVSGAAVVFALPVSGASGEFVNGGKNYTVVTGADGQATVPGLKTNDIPGKLQIYVTASYRGLRARALINQVVEAAGAKPKSAELRASKSGGKWKWVLLGMAAAGGAGAGLYYERQHTTAAAPTPISISTGMVVFGSPR